MRVISWMQDTCVFAFKNAASHLTAPLPRCRRIFSAKGHQFAMLAVAEAVKPPWPSSLHRVGT